MTAGKTFRFLKFLQITATAGALLLGTMLASPAAAQQLPPPIGPETGDALPQTVRELRRCLGGLPESVAKAWVGARFICNAFEIYHAAARRALESVVGLDLTGGERGIGRVYNAGKDADQVRSLQGIGVGSLYGWSGTPLGERRDTSLFPIAENEDPGLANWADGLQNVFPVTENSHGEGAITRITVLDRQGQVEQAVRDLAPPGDPLPEFKGERADAAVGAVIGGPALAAARTLATNEIAVPAAKNRDTLGVITAGLIAGITSGDSPIAPVARINPGDPIANPLGNATKQEAVTSAGLGSLTAGGLGRTAELSGLGEASSSIPSDIVNRDILDTLAGIIANSAQNRLNSIANASNFLGPTAGELANLLGPENFRNLASNLFSGPGGTPQFPGFPPGGGPQRLADIPTGPATPAGSCDPQRSTISSDGARALATFLRLPPTTDQANPWELQYVEAQRAYSQRGTDPSTGGVRTITQGDFPNPTACVWVVSHAPPGASRTAAFIEDTQDTSGKKFILSIN